jgi:hypothetical protein
MGLTSRKRHIVRLVAQWMTSTRRRAGPESTGPPASVRRRGWWSGVARRSGCPQPLNLVRRERRGVYPAATTTRPGGTDRAASSRGSWYPAAPDPVNCWQTPIKVSATAKGRRRDRAGAHILTDPAQNHRFNDIYVGEPTSRPREDTCSRSTTAAGWTPSSWTDGGCGIPIYDRAGRRPSLQKACRAYEVLSRFERQRPSQPGVAGVLGGACQGDVGMRSCASSAARARRSTCAATSRTARRLPASCRTKNATARAPRWTRRSV